MVTTSAIEQAERKGRWLANYLGVLAVVLVVLLVVTLGHRQLDTLRGLQAGLTVSALLALTPFLRWAKPNNPIAHLLNDETTQAHRRSGATAGLVAAVTASFAMLIVTEETRLVTAEETARVIMTAAVAAALLCFSVLERRAAQ